MRDGSRRPRVTVEFGDVRERGQAIDLADADVSASDVAAAIEGRSSRVSIRCPSPGPLFRHVGVIDSGMDLSVRAGLATIARQRGHESEAEAELDVVRSELEELSVPSVDVTPPHRRLARTDTTEAELEERVARLQGAVGALDEHGIGETSQIDALAASVRELSEVRTERIAAEQALDRRREEVRAARDARERRLRLQDREGNLERRVRRELADAVYDEFVAALEAVPGGASPGSDVTEFEGDDVTAALAIVRMARPRAPVVLDCDRFESSAAAARRLDAPVIRL